MRPSPLTPWLRSAKLRRALAVSSVVLATGGLVLYKAHPTAALGGVPLSANGGVPLAPLGGVPLSANGASSVAFRAHGARGTFAISHTKVLSERTTPVFAEVRLVADRRDGERERAPVSLAIVLDTSGSMRGAKLEDAKRSVLRLIAAMRDDDEIAVVRYSDDSQLVQPLARVGDVRGSLASRVGGLTAGGGTNIPSGLSHGLREIDEARTSRVRRIVLVSDGLDGTRARAEELARSSFRRSITVSSLGIGLDFDQGYMAAVAESGQGNFAFIEDGGSLGSFLDRELRETSTTTIEDARVTLDLPRGLRFVSATGAEASANGASVELRLGSLFAGDERRVIVELAAEDIAPGSSEELRASAEWALVGAGRSVATIPTLAISGTASPAEVQRASDPSVLASATSVLSSKRQLEAADAYARGDVATALALASESEAALGAAMQAAPAAAPALSAQRGAYSRQRQLFAESDPRSAEGKAAAKSAAAKEVENMRRVSSY